MATIFRLRSGSWRVQIRRAGERPISKTFDKKAEAVDWSRVMEGDRDNIAAVTLCSWPMRCFLTRRRAALEFRSRRATRIP
jgi:hypothetical protein